MSDRKQQIRDAIGFFWTGLTGTRAEVLDRGDQIARDVKRQVDERRRPLNQPIDAEGERVDDDDEHRRERT